MTAVDPAPTFDDLADLGAAVGAALVDAGQRVAIGESSSAGLVSAALLSVGGASAFYLGGAVIYTGRARRFLFEPDELPPETRGATEDYAGRLARAARAALGADWAIAETGAAGPTGNPYGDPPGHAWVGVARPDGTTVARVVATGDDDRVANMFRFAAAGLDLLRTELRKSG